ncbi:MAG: AAA family ATPase [Cyanobacteria bacterium P01_F01_bin.143]
MNQFNSFSKLGNYIAECARLLYWSYFKPYTLTRWLQDIHPDLKPMDNPYLKLKQFPHNKSLYHYAEQGLWLTVIVPQLVVFLVGPIYTGVTRESFDWLISESLISGLIFGQIIFVYRSGFRRKNLWFIAISNLIVIVLLFAFGVVSGVTSSVVVSLAKGAAFSVVVSVIVSVERDAASGVASSVADGVAFGVAFGVVGGVASGVTFGVVYGVTFGVASGVVERVVLGVLLGALLGILFGVAFGMAFSMAWILGVLRVYFWLPELLWIGLLFLFRQQGRFASRLRYLPPYFDQLIHLPLPFLSTILVEAFREQPNAAHETITYLNNFTNQQKVAAVATLNFTLDTMANCQTLREVINITQELAWIPTPAPPEIAKVLPQFLDISRSVQSADLATSVYRKAEILKNPIDSLNQMQTSFAFEKNNRIAKVSSNIAQKWLSILETARLNFQEQSRYAQEIPQVYIAGAALDPETAQNRFKGRQDIFWEIENLSLMSPPPTLLLYGGRRTGKTSTLKYLPQKVGGDLIPLRVDVQGIADAITLPGLAKSLVQQIIDSARISRNLTLPPPDKEELKTEPFPTLRDWFTTIERIAPGKRFLLCLDEFERLEEVIAETNSRAPLNFLRHVIQHRAAWTLLFSGSHTLDEIEDYWSDYLINTRSVRVTYLEQPEAEELIVHPVPEFPDIYLPETVNRIIYWTRCQPYLVQLVCSELVDYLNRENPENALQVKATPEDVDRVIDRALITGGAYFDELWKNTLNAQQREAIRNLVNETEPTVSDRKIWSKLIKKEILESDSRDRVKFQVPLIAKSITQKIEEEI